MIATEVQTSGARLATMVDDYKARLEHAMKHAGCDAAQLRAHLKISYQGMAKVLAGGRFGMENNLKAAKFLGVRSEWLATGTGSMVDEEKRLFPEVAKLAAEINRLPKRQRDLVLLSIGNTVTLANTVTQDQDGTGDMEGLPESKASETLAEKVITDTDRMLNPDTPQSAKPHTRQMK